MRKRQRRLAGVDEITVSLYAQNLTTGEIAAHLADAPDGTTCQALADPGAGGSP